MQRSTHNAPSPRSLSTLLRTKAACPGVGEPPTEDRSGKNSGDLSRARPSGGGISAAAFLSLGSFCLRGTAALLQVLTLPCGQLFYKVELTPGKHCTAHDEVELASQLVNFRGKKSKPFWLCVFGGRGESGTQSISSRLLRAPYRAQVSKPPKSLQPRTGAPP